MAQHILKKFPAIKILLYYPDFCSAGLHFGIIIQYAERIESCELLIHFIWQVLVVLQMAFKIITTRSWWTHAGQLIVLTSRLKWTGQTAKFMRGHQLDAVKNVHNSFIRFYVTNESVVNQHISLTNGYFKVRTMFLQIMHFYTPLHKYFPSYKPVLSLMKFVKCF